MDILVGYTGFVGSNIVKKHRFDEVFNSKNIELAFGKNPDLLVYAGVPAEMYIANQNPEADKIIIENAINNIKRINPKKLVLISTIGVYENPVGVDEDSIIDTERVLPYGKNRLMLEKWVEDNISDYLIVRLPGLFGSNIKKNFIYDFINVIPSMLSEEKYLSLICESNNIQKFYIKQANGFYKCQVEDVIDKQLLKREFKKIGFTALNFTDSRGVFQYYNLSHLWDDIVIAQKNKIRKLNLAVEPISIEAIYNYITNDKFENILNKPVPHFDFYTKHASAFGRTGKYIYSKEETLEEIKEFIRNQLEQEGELE